MAKALKITVGVFFLLIAAALIIPFFIPAETFKEPVIAAVERSTGRTLTIKGPLGLKFRPGLELTITDAALSNAPGASEPFMAQMDTMTLGLDWKALLSRQIVISKFVLNEPVIHLEIMEDGKANWDFANGDAPVEEKTSTDSQTANAAKDALAFGDLRIVDGRLTWKNRAAGQDYELADVNINIALPNLSDPARIEGTFTYAGEDMKLELLLASLNAVTSGEETPFTMTFSTRLVNAALDGTFTGGAQTTLKARANVDVPSVRQLATWAKTPITSPGGFGAFSIQGDLLSKGPLMAFTNANVSFDDMNAQGSLTVKTGGKKPALSGKLNVDKVDVRPYMPEKLADTGEDEPKKDLAWDKTALDLSGLKTVDVNFDLTTKAFYFQDYEIGNADLSLIVKNNKLTATLNQMALYGGQGKGTLTVDANRAAAKIGSAFTFTDIKAGPLLKAATARDLAEGTGNLSFNLNTSGKSQHDLMQSLAGKGALKLNDGKINGVNLTRIQQILSVLKPAKTQAPDPAGEAQTQEQTGSGQATEFVEMGGTFTVAKGILQTSDFGLINDTLSLAGTGKVNLGKQTINMKLAPGQRQDDGGTQVKMKVQGPWNNIKYTPDFEDVVKSSLRDAILGGKADKEPTLEGEVVNSVLKSIFGGKKD